MQLVERWPGNLPVRFLVQIAERHCVGKQLVELGGDFQPNQLFEFKGQQMVDRSVCLNFSRALMKPGLRYGSG